MRALLHRIAAASPLLPALIYTAAAWLAMGTVAFAPANKLLVVLTVFVWIATALLFLTVVVWFRDDDWLAAGFLLDLTLILSDWTARLLVQTIAERSVGPAIFSAPGMLLGVAIRGIIGIPLLGALVALLRWITRLVRPSRQPPVGAPPA